ncbi:hypothetical protein OOZ54_13240 [Rhodopseudomonas palustris]|uniref:hypothetical protein n=1 Tax=Rhodopseudomonas palustris TaxID=1076 RepID=UPI0022F092F8|nr:hypothetical protein [Rhodopseudomonas palustris]WBU27628.1 hypothetical protein OOZ54_13240 [Rhodopseudomonas palustris]
MSPTIAQLVTASVGKMAIRNGQHPANETGKEHTMWHTFDTLPDIGRKFIALYNDGSGASLFYRHEDGYLDEDGNEFGDDLHSYDYWAYLPAGKSFWCEDRSDDPVKLPDVSAGCLTEDEKRDQADRCGCRGANDLCGCQNEPDAATVAKRAAMIANSPDDGGH